MAGPSGPAAGAAPVGAVPPTDILPDAITGVRRSFATGRVYGSAVGSAQPYSIYVNRCTTRFAFLTT